MVNCLKEDKKTMDCRNAVYSSVLYCGRAMAMMVGGVKAEGKGNQAKAVALVAGFW